MKSKSLIYLIIILLLIAGLSAEAEDSEAESPANYSSAEAIIIDTDPAFPEKPVSAASDSTVRNRDFMNFPRRTASDLMRFIPGLSITQHTGGAKAHQIFLRGFDAEHGQDIAAFIDGIPLNESSHVHGQGYLDLHFILPETIEKIKVMKGPYETAYGNFANAGTINFIPYRQRDYSFCVAAEGGNYLTLRGLAGYSGDILDSSVIAAAEADRTDGYTEPGELKAGRFFFHNCWPMADASELRILYAGYLARSEAADILPLELIKSGEVSEFGALDDSNGVDCDRHLTALTWEKSLKNRKIKLQGYYNYKDTRIFSNYSFYYFNPERGDQLEQHDSRHYGGMQGCFEFSGKLFSLEHYNKSGFSLRNDTVNQSQSYTEKRESYNKINSYSFNETSAGAYTEERIKLTGTLFIIAGLRYDMIFYNGRGEQDRLVFDIYSNSSVTENESPVEFSEYAHMASPKASLAFSPLEDLSLFINFGRGIVSAQARQMAWEPESGIPAVTGAEAGTRFRLFGGIVETAAAGWYAGKEAEYVFDSEAGCSVQMGPSRRLGADLELRVSPLEWIYAGTDLNYVHAVFTDSGAAVPNMANWIMTNVISISHPAGTGGSIRGRYSGERTHDLGHRSGDYYIIDLQISQKVAHFLIFTLSAENIADTVWYDSVFAYPSRPYSGGESVNGLHVTRGTPRTWKIQVEARF